MRLAESHRAAIGLAYSKGHQGRRDYALVAPLAVSLGAVLGYQEPGNLKLWELGWMTGSGRFSQAIKLNKNRRFKQLFQYSS